MRKLVDWILQRFCPESDEDDLFIPDPELERKNQIADENLIMRFRQGGQANLQDVLCACVRCDVDYYGLLREHNRAFQARSRTAA